MTAVHAVMLRLLYKCFAYMNYNDKYEFSIKTGTKFLDIICILLLYILYCMTAIHIMYIHVIVLRLL